MYIRSMLYFDCDYNNGCHPKVLEALVSTNGEYSGTYGGDHFCAAAKNAIREACEDPDADVFFLAGGTQTNSTVIDCLLRPWQGVVAAPTGHIAVHEAGAVEYSGHKVFTLPGASPCASEGKMDPSELESLLKSFKDDPTRDHMAEPALVYISLPTELGGLYSAAELQLVFETAHRYGAPLFVDGARLAYALAAEGNDISLPFLAAHCDAFYIGGTKCGALCGEAVVFPRAGAPDHFFTRIKQHGALLAKGRLAGVQFGALFEDGLYKKTGREADRLASLIPGLFRKYGLGREDHPSRTNQQFILVRSDILAELSSKVAFEVWQETPPGAPGFALCRFVTSWATVQEDISELEKVLMALC